MIGHNHEGINRCVGKMAWQRPPALVDNLAEPAEPHLAILYSAKDALLVPHADCHEVGPGLGVVVAWKPNGPAVMAFRVIGHQSTAFRAALSGKVSNQPLLLLLPTSPQLASGPVLGCCWNPPPVNPLRTFISSCETFSRGPRYEWSPLRLDDSHLPE